MDSLFTPWRTPGGVRFLLAPVPWTRDTLALWDEAREVWDWPNDLAVLPAVDAQDFLERAENAHARHGFYLLPGWRGLHIPASCPTGVALDLQAVYLCTAYVGEVAHD